MPRIDRPDEGPGEVDGDRARANVWKGYALAALAASAWATGGLVAKWLFSPLDAVTSQWPVPPPGLEVDPTTLAGARAWVSAAAVVVYVAARRPRRLLVSTRDLPFLGIFGVAGLAGVHVAYLLAISHTNVATAILLEYLAPVLTLAVSVVALGERFTWTLPVGVALSVTGCALVVGVFGGGRLAVSAPGVFWGLASAVFFAGYSLMGRYAASRFSPWTLLCYGLGFASLFWLFFLGGPERMLELMRQPEAALGVGYIAIMSTILPFGAFLAALHYIDATKALVTSTLEPVLAGVLAFPLLGEVFDGWQILGGLLVIVAIMVVQQRPRTRYPLPPTP